MFQAIIASSMESALQIANQLSINRLFINGESAGKHYRDTLPILRAQYGYSELEAFERFISQRGNLPTFYWTASDEELEYARVGIVRNPSTACAAATLPPNTLDSFGTVGSFLSNLVVVETPDQTWFWYYRNKFGPVGSNYLTGKEKPSILP